LTYKSNKGRWDFGSESGVVEELTTESEIAGGFDFTAGSSRADMIYDYYNGYIFMRM
jgi:hypothetical protein